MKKWSASKVVTHVDDKGKTSRIAPKEINSAYRKDQQQQAAARRAKGK